MLTINLKTPVMYDIHQYWAYRQRHPEGPVRIEFGVGTGAPVAPPRSRVDGPEMVRRRARLARLEAGPVAPPAHPRPAPASLPAGWRPAHADR